MEILRRIPAFGSLGRGLRRAAAGLAAMPGFYLCVSLGAHAAAFALAARVGLGPVPAPNDCRPPISLGLETSPPPPPQVSSRQLRLDFTGLEEPPPPELEPEEPFAEEPDTPAETGAVCLVGMPLALLPAREERLHEEADAGTPVSAAPLGPAEDSPSVADFDLGLNRPPEYPLLARRLGWQGETLLELELLPDGVPARVTVLRSSGHRLLDDAAVAAAREWRFRVPAGAPGRRVLVPVVFQLR